MTFFFDHDVPAFDMGGAVRSAVESLRRLGHLGG